jgi:hypothetical protein
MRRQIGTPIVHRSSQRAVAAAAAAAAVAGAPVLEAAAALKCPAAPDCAQALLQTQ